MKAPAGAKLEVTLLIDQDQWDELINKGFTERHIAQMIKNTLTLREPGFRQPVSDMKEVTLLKYYLNLILL